MFRSSSPNSHNEASYRLPMQAQRYYGAMATLPSPYLTVDQYIELEQKLDAKFEYYQGQVYAMSGASPAHVYIQSNLVRHLGNELEGTACAALGSDLRVHVEASGLYTYPDVTIICGALAVDRKNGATNPRVLFEILSPSTSRYDRVGKFEHYRQIASLEEYVLVEQAGHAIDRHKRLPDGRWELTQFLGEDAVLELASVNISIPLQQIYRNVPFELAEQP